MPRFLALDWDAGHAYLVAANVSKGAVKLEQALTWPEEHPPVGAAAAGFGHRLKERLKDAGIAAAPLLVAVGRDRVVVKDVKFPPVPPHEEPAIVRFQAMKELTEAVEDLVLDYFAAPDLEPTGEKKAFVVAYRKDLLNGWKAAAAVAGLKIAAVTPRAFATVAALRRRTAQPAPDPGTAFAALSVGEKGGEFVVARGEQLALARQLSAAARSTDAALVGEIRRNLAVYAGQAGQQPVRALYVAEAASPAIGLADRLRDTLAVPVYGFDPLSGLANAPAGSRGDSPAPPGLLRLRARAATLPINFVQPREPKAPRDPNKRALGWAGAAAAALVFTLGAFGYSRLSAKEKELAELRAEKDDLAEQLRDLDIQALKNKHLDDWLKTDICWLDELYDLTDRFPDIEKLRVTHLGVRPSPTRTSRFAAFLDLKGLVTEDSKALTALKTEFITDAYYGVGAMPVARNRTGVNRAQFSQEWSTNPPLQVEKRLPAKYERKLTAKAPPKKGEKAAADGQGGEQ